MIAKSNPKPLPNDDAAHQIEQCYVRGMSNYELYGRHAPHETASRNKRNHFVSQRLENAYLMHERFGPALKNQQTPDPKSNIPFLDQNLAKRFEPPSWERGYHIKGRISISGQSKQLYVNGRLFEQSTREKPAPNHKARQRIQTVAQSFFGKTVHLDQALWLSHPFAICYFHTYHNVMTQIALADELGISRKVPIIIEKEWADTPYGQHFLKSDLFKNRKTVLLTPDMTLTCKSVYMLLPALFSPTLLDRVAASFPEQKPKQDYSDRLVLVRDRGTHNSRSCSNMDDLISALTADGFSPLDPATLTIPEQKWVFARTRHIVTENGSALTNIVHRRGRDLQIDALMASTFPTVTFQCLSKAYGFQYRAHVLPSTNTNAQVNFKITPQVMDNILNLTTKKIRTYA